MTEQEYMYKAFEIDPRTLLHEHKEGVRNLIDKVISLQKEIQEMEEGNVPMYCPTCTSCGESGCCSPDSCIAVKCLYEGTNKKSYEEAQAENSIYWDFVEECEKSGDFNTRTAAKAVKDKIHDLWSEPHTK